MLQRRTDLAAEAGELAKKNQKDPGRLPGVRSCERRREGYAVGQVEILDGRGAALLGKPAGRYVTLDLTSYWERREEYFSRAVRAVGEELRALLPPGEGGVLAVGLGNADMTPDAIGPLAVRHILPTRHLKTPGGPFQEFDSVCAVAAEVVGKTGVEAAEQVKALTEKLRPRAVLLIDALAARSLQRLGCTVQLSDTGLVPGSGVGNHRAALDEASLGTPVVSIGVPTVVEGGTLALDLLEEAGAAVPESLALRPGLFVTPKEVDEQVRELARVVGYGVNAALHGLSAEDSAALLG
ncbi:MAG: GPR endopeptidase [Oscillospiraceae bacterium]